MSGFADLYIDDKTNDLVSQNGKVVLATGDTEVIQRVKIRLRRIFGEWFLYYTAGIPYFNGRMLGANDYDYVKLTLRKEIINTLGVTGCNNMNLIIDNATKKVSIYAEINVNSNIYSINEEL